MKKVISSFSNAVLSREQMKKVVGGSGECGSCSESSCSGGCTSNSGASGTCGWTAADQNRCTCASVGGGGIE